MNESVYHQNQFPKSDLNQTLKTQLNSEIKEKDNLAQKIILDDELLNHSSKRRNSDIDNFIYDDEEKFNYMRDFITKSDIQHYISTSHEDENDYRKLFDEALKTKVNTNESLEKKMKYKIKKDYNEDNVINKDIIKYKDYIQHHKIKMDKEVNVNIHENFCEFLVHIYEKIVEIFYEIFKLEFDSEEKHDDLSDDIDYRKLNVSDIKYINRKYFPSYVEPNNDTANIFSNIKGNKELERN